MERPASVVKELVENSLDAGASQIAVEVSGGGLKLIRVVDDGAGIPSADVETAFLRHATSKLTSSSDLEKIATLGFRGEALPSIASVSDMELLTRVESEQAGTRVRLQAGELMKREAVGRPRGTTVRVTHLFQNVPARLKFMKSVATENGRIGNLVTRYAMARPSVRFSLTIDGRKTLSTTGAGGSARGGLQRLWSGHGRGNARVVGRGGWSWENRGPGWTANGEPSPDGIRDPCPERSVDPGQEAQLRSGRGVPEPADGWA